MRGPLALLVLLVAVALSGCLAPAQPIAPQDFAGDAFATVATVAHRAGALVGVPAEVQDFVVRVSPTGFQRGEPTLGITSGGVIFTVAGAGMDSPGLPDAGLPLPLPAPGPNNRFASVARSTDHGQTWEQLWDPVMMGKIDFDPWVWVDPATDRVFHAPLYIVCSHLAWSDDLGDTWQSHPAGGCGLPAHDHQKLTSGPAPEGVTAGDFGSLLYYAYNSFRGEGTLLSRSLDGGLTWQDEQVVHPQDACLGGIAGPVAVGSDGIAYSPKPTCDGVQVAVSQDGGQTWGAPVRLEGLEAPPHTFYNPDVAVDSEGNAYLVTHGGDGLVWLSVSRDRGATWSAPVKVTPPGLTSTVFTNIVAGGPGRLAVSYLATDDDVAAWTSADPSEARDEAVWHTYLAYSTDALAAEPTFTTQRVTTPEDPAQVGCVWLRGGSEPCRNLRDFADLQQWEGRPYLVYADGCDACSTAEDSRRLGETTVVIVERGPNLFGGQLQPLL